MSMVLGIAGFLLLIASTCLTEATVADIVIMAAAGLALMAAGRLWRPCVDWVQEKRRRLEAVKAAKTRQKKMPAAAATVTGGMQEHPKQTTPSV